MSVTLSGYTNALGPSVQYEYRKSVIGRTDGAVRFILELRLKPSADVDVQVQHGAKVYPVAIGNASSVYREATLKRSDSTWGAGEWTGWFTVFDAQVPIGIDDNMLYTMVKLGTVPFEFDETSGALEDGTDIGKYPRPANTVITSLEPTSFNVADQNYYEVKVTWRQVADATYRVYVNTQMNMTGVQVVEANSTAASCTFNPKQHMVGGLNWRQTEILAGTEYYVGVEPRDASNVASTDIAWAGPIRYYGNATLAPNRAYVVGWCGEKNEIAMCGEKGARLYYSGDSAGSYPIGRLVLCRQDGIEAEWAPSDAKVDSNGKYVSLDFEKWGVQNAYVQFELRAYDSMGHPAYMSDGSWLKFSVKHYGGFVSVYGKGENLGSEYDYDHLDGDEAWRSGFCWVYDGSKWRRAASVHVYSGTSWGTVR